MKLKIAIVLLICFSALGLHWVAKPWMVVDGLGWVSKKGEDEALRQSDRIVALGERAIPAILHSIEKYGVLRSRYFVLPSTLSRIGGSAHQDLLNRIDKQNDPAKRDRLIIALHGAFDDSSRDHLIVDLSRDRLKPPKK